MKKSLLFLLSYLITNVIGFTQQRVKQREIDKQGNVSFMVFNNKFAHIPITDAKKLLHDSLKFQKDDDFVLNEEMKDKLGFTHYFYTQHYKGIKVHHGLYSVHSRNDKIEYIDGQFKNIKNVNITPSLSEKEALQKALDYIHAVKYKWENPNDEQFIKFYKNDSTATFFPKGELLICKDELKTNSIYKLAYKFDIYAANPLSHQLYYVDALTGEILNIENLIWDLNVTGTAETRYSGTQTITTDSYNNTTTPFRLQETRNGVFIGTFNMKDKFTYREYDFSDNDNNWTAAEYNNLNYDNAALDVHWGIEKVCDYWYYVWQRRSLDNDPYYPNPLFNYVHTDLTKLKNKKNNDNAIWDGVCMSYGDGQYTFNPVVSLDVIAHETAHGFTEYTCQLGDKDETGALNEGFSDIWAAVIEHWAAPNDPTKKTWLCGEQIMKDGTYVRSMSSPKEKGNPDTYKGVNWDYNNDKHKNSTVLSHWFYLLSEGGSGKNDLNNTYKVYGIGINNAASIVFQAETSSLRSHSDANYNSAMTYINQAAIDKYGENSLEVMQVKNAWYAVGLGTQPLQFYITGPTLICSTSTATYTLNNVPSGATVKWNSSYGLTLVSTSGNSATFSANQNYNGAGWVTAGGASFNGIQYNVWVGAPAISRVTGTSYCQIGTYVSYEASITNLCANATSYNWALIPSVYNNNFAPSGNHCYITWNTVSNYVLTVNAINNCGTSSTSYYPINIVSNSRLSLSPNPASNNVQVSILKTQNTALTSDTEVATSLLKTTVSQDITSTYTVKIYNSFGSLFYSSKQTGDSFTIPVNNLKDGTYIVEANDGKQSYKQTLVIKH